MSTDTPGPLRAWWRRQQFEPSAAGLLVNPFYFARRGLREGLGEFLPALSGDVLDVGCGRKPYQHLTRATRYIGVDIDTPATRALSAADHYYDGRTLPFANASFDAVLCSQVLEHVFTPVDFLREINRVLKPGGVLLLATPFVWDEHEQPQDFGRYSSFGLPDLLRQSGFVSEGARKTNADFRAVTQLASGYVYKVTRTQSTFLNVLVQLALIAPLNVTGGLLAWLLPANPDLYLDNIVLARKAPANA